jgi:hypothetical protein
LTGQELLTHLQSLKEVQVKAPPELMSMTFQVGNRFEILYWTARDASGVRQGGTYSIAPDQNLVCFRIPAELRAGGFGVGSEWMSDCFRVSQTDEKTYSLKNLKGDYSRVVDTRERTPLDSPQTSASVADICIGAERFGLLEPSSSEAMV